MLLFLSRKELLILRDSLWEDLKHQAQEQQVPPLARFPVGGRISFPALSTTKMSLLEAAKEIWTQNQYSKVKEVNA